LNQQTCDSDRLDACIRGDLDREQESELILHLDNCDECRSSIELRAGEECVWQEAQDMLTGWRLHRIEAATGAENSSAVGDTQLGNDSEAMDLQLRKVQGALAPTDDPTMLGRLGPYEVSGIVGSGAMGVVLKAHDRSLDRVIAIKVMAPHLASSGSARKRFAREAKAAAAVLHPNVIAIHSVSNKGELPYLVMAYLRGESLQKRLDREGPLPVSEALRIGSQIAAGLAAAHAQGLVHRDIKPANILLEEGVERVAITDFGLARAVDDATMTRSGVIAGTPQYMSPEQARGETIDARSDLFSLGSVLYTMCTGRVPFRAETTFGVLQRINNTTPRSIREINAEIPDWLCGIIENLMSKQPEDRLEPAEKVAELLEDSLAHVQQPDIVNLPEAVSAVLALPKRPRKHIGVIAMIAASLLALFGLFGVIANDPTDNIDGVWSGEAWSLVELTKTKPGVYEGTVALPSAVATSMDNDNDGSEVAEKGYIKLKWSRVFNRYRGTWGKGKIRYGKISVRRVNDEVHGAWSTNSKSSVDGSDPPLDFVWTRRIANDGNVGPTKEKREEIKLRGVVSSTSIRSGSPKIRQVPRMVVQTNLRDAAFLRVGQRCEVAIDAIPNEKYGGRVTDVERGAAVTTESSANAEYEIRISFESWPDLLLKESLTATASFRIDRENGVHSANLLNIRQAEVLRKKTQLQLAKNEELRAIELRQKNPEYISQIDIDRLKVSRLELEAAVMVAEAAVEPAQVETALSRTNLKATVQRRELDLKEAQYKFELAQTEFKRFDKLLASKSVSRPEWSKAKTTKQLALVAVERAELELLNSQSALSQNDKNMKQMGIVVADPNDARPPRNGTDSVAIEKERAMAAKAASRKGGRRERIISVGHRFRKVATITRLLVKSGTRVEAGAILVELSADGTSVSILSPVSGVVHCDPKLRVGTKINEGQAILSIYEVSD